MVKSDLVKIIRGEILDDEQTLNFYSKDASIFKIEPQLIIYPKDAEDIKNLIKFINKNSQLNLSLTPRSAGTCMSGGAINDSIILDMTKYFNQVINVTDDTATTQPGVFYRDFEKKTLEKDLILPCFTASREINTVGGMVGNNSAGEKTLSYGQTARYVKRLKVILADGNEYILEPLTNSELNKKIAQKDFEGRLYSKIFDLIKENSKIIQESKPKTHKNSTGYLLWDVWDGQIFDLSKLIVGSQGTLGVVTEIEFELVHPKKYQSLLVVSLDNLSNLDQIINKVLEYKPESFECFDNRTLKYAVRFLSEISKNFKHNNQLLIYLKFLPEIIQNMLGQLPKLVLMANFTDESQDQADLQAKQASDRIKSFRVKTKVISEVAKAEKYWIIRHESFNMLRHHSENMTSSPFIDDIIVDPKYLPEFLPKLNQIIIPYKDKLIYTVAGHIGEGNFHIIPLMDLKRGEVRAIIPEISQKVFDLVFEYQGSMSGEHNDGLVRGAYLPQMYGEECFQLFKQVKSIFDPNNIFNPHKKTDASFEYSFEHIVKD